MYLFLLGLLIGFAEGAAGGVVHPIASGDPWFHLLTRPAPKPRLAAGGIRAGVMPLGQLGHGAGTASSGRTKIGGNRCG